MSIKEICVELLQSIAPLAIPMALTGLLTLAAAIVFSIFGRDTWPNKRFFSCMGLFYSLKGYNIVRLACSWTKMWLLIFFLASVKILSAEPYLILILLSVLYSIEPGRPVRIPGNLLSCMMAPAGLLTTNILLGYIQDLKPSNVFYIIYIALSIFMVIYGIYLFLNEVSNISQSRRPDFE